MFSLYGMCLVYSMTMGHIDVHTSEVCSLNTCIGCYKSKAWSLPSPGDTIFNRYVPDSLSGCGDQLTWTPGHGHGAVVFFLVLNGRMLEQSWWGRLVGMQGRDGSGWWWWGVHWGNSTTPTMAFFYFVIFIILVKLILVCKCRLPSM